jgi:hypothetical protein
MNGASRGFFLVSLFIFSACISITPLNSNLNNLESSDSLDDISLKPASSSSELNENSTQNQDSNGNFSDACLNDDAEPCISPSKWHFERMLNDGLNEDFSNSDKALDFSPNGTIIATAYGNLTRIIDVEYGLILQELVSQTLQSPSESPEYEYVPFIFSTAFSKDGMWLATGGNGVAIQIWNTENWEQITSITPIMDNNYDAIPGVNSLMFSPNGLILAIGLQNNAIIVIETQNWTEINRLDTSHLNLVDMEISPNGNQIAMVGQNEDVHFWNTINWTYSHSLYTDVERTMSSDYPSPKALKYSNDGETLAVIHLGGHIDIWNCSNWNLSHSLQGDRNKFHSDITVSPDGGVLVTMADRTLRVWNLSSYEFEDFDQSSDGAEYSKFSFSPDGKRIAWGSASNIKLYSGIQVEEEDLEVTQSEDDDLVFACCCFILGFGFLALLNGGDVAETTQEFASFNVGLLQFVFFLLKWTILLPITIILALFGIGLGVQMDHTKGGPP